MTDRATNAAELGPMQSGIADRRSTMWTYYDRRVAHREPGPQAVHNYFRGLGVDADLAGISAELDEVGSRLRELPATTFVDIGAGPSGAFTVHLPGRGVALDQSDAALRQIRMVAPDIPAVRGDAMRLPLRTKAVGRVLVSHLYGLLLPDERATLVAEAGRVADEMVIVDSGRPAGVRAEEWQTRVLPDGTSYPIYRRHLDVETLLDEVGGEALFEGLFFVIVRTAISG